MCSALFAAERLLLEACKESVVAQFKLKAGGLLCSEIKEKQFICAEYVQMTNELHKIS